MQKKRTQIDLIQKETIQIQFEAPKRGQLYQCKVWGHRFLIGGFDRLTNSVYGTLYPNPKPLKTMQELLTKAYDDYPGAKDSVTRDEFKAEIGKMLREHDYIAENLPITQAKTSISDFSDDWRIMDSYILQIMHAIYKEKEIPMKFCFSLIG